MNIKRSIARSYTPAAQPGFLGRGHLARPVVQGDFRETDPFIILMDDMLDKKDNIPVGGPHPHGGFETVSLLLEGEIGDEEHGMKAGDFEIMTAGSGIVHTETIDKQAKMRLLQLWLNLPKKDRKAAPRLQHLSSEQVPAASENGVTIRLYSGTMAGLQSPILNYSPLIVADITLDSQATTVLQLPANYNAFLYMIDGNTLVGEKERPLQKDSVGWLDLFDEATPSELKVAAGKEGARFVLYAGKPTGDSIVSYGPFIGDSTDQIQGLYQDYRRGRMEHISDVAASQRIFW